ncbi:hypothetical protein M1N23_00155 [Dehalococcoidia bacterium]|nr:hypothetical protein [Dehalococcoidia bacterium]
MPLKKNVLITGVADLIGRVFREGLGDDYELSVVDMTPVDGFDGLVTDSTTLAVAQPAFEGVDMVVGLVSVAD